MNDYRAYVENDYNAIYHHGIKGQRWGIRRYQNEDGSLTPLGRKHYGYLIKQYKKAGMSDKEIEDLNVDDVKKARVLEILQVNGDANLPYVPLWVIGAGGMAANASDDEIMRDAKKRNNRK